MVFPNGKVLDFGSAVAPLSCSPWHMQIWPWNAEQSKAKASRVLPRERTGHSKHPLPTTQEKTSPDGQHRNQIDYILYSQRWRSSIYSAKTRPGADCGCKEYNQSNFGVDHLMMSMCRVFSCVVGRGCSLWPVHSLGKTLLAFALLHSAFQGQICLLPQVFLNFLLLHSSLL